VRGVPDARRSHVPTRIGSLTCIGFDNERAAYAALRATLHAVRDRLPTELVAHLGAELPMLVRGIYYDGWHPSAVKLKAAHDEDFFDAMRRELRGHEELQHVEQVARTVLRVIDQRLEPGRGRIASQLGRFQVGLRLARRDSAGRNRPTTIGAGASTSSQNGEDSPGREDVHCQTDEDKEFDRRRAGA